MVMTKSIVALGAKAVVFPLVLLWKIYFVCTGREALFTTFSQMLSLVPGKTGVYLRKGFYCLVFEKCFDDVHIGFETIFSHADVQIEKGVYIGSRCTIGMAEIGEGVLIGSNVDILSGRHQHARDHKGHLADPGKRAFQRIIIGAHSWIGNSAVVMANIGRTCTVGAGSVVVTDVDDGQTVAGNPARTIYQDDRSLSR
ncbi:MAG: acyltransferase [Nitrospiraceae bacterium]